MTPEKKVKNKVVAILKEHKAYYFYPMTGGYGRSGVPDIVGCYRGIFFGIECKAKGNKPTALQNKNLSDIMSAGGMAMIVNENNISDVEYMLRSIRDEETAYE
jgi:Holliday junction resolvase